MTKRKRVSVSLDAELLGAVDRYVCDHPETDRSNVIDDALWLWAAERQREAMEAQYAQKPTEEEQREWADWRHIQRANTERLLATWQDLDE